MLTHNNEIEIKIQNYLSNISVWLHRTKAEAEEDLWKDMLALHGKGLTLKEPRRNWLRRVLKGTGYKIFELHSTILRHPGSDAMWGALDSGMLMHTAHECFRKAKDRTSTEEGMVEALAEELSAVDRKVLPPVKGSERTFHQNVIKLLERDVAGKVAGLDAYLVQQLKADYGAFLREAHEDLHRDLDRMHRKKAERKVVARRVTREGFGAACEVLGTFIRFGEDVDLRDIRRRALKRAGELHPDKNQGSGARNEEYQRVIEARNLLVRYQEDRKTNG